MANELFCMGCMQPISEFSDSCYHCGYPVTGQNPAGYLPVRTQLGERYIVGRALEKRGDAIVYIGYDRTAKNAVLLREFFPDGVAERLSKQVVAADGKEEIFDKLLEQFRRQSRVIARMRDLPAMIPVYDMFDDNGTMYTVADQIEAVPFRRYLQTLGGHMKWEEARPLFVPLLSSLVSVHASGLYHLGISPDSILVDSENRLRLDGWQLAEVRVEGSVLQKRLPEHYAAPEQYEAGASVSQQADVYALAATMLYALTGEEPPKAVDRVNKTASLRVPADVAEKWPAHIAPTLCDAMLLDAGKRIKTVELLRDRLTVAPVVEALREGDIDELDEYSSYHPPKASTGLGYKITVWILAVLCVLMAGAIAWLLISGNPFVLDEAPRTTETTTTTQTTNTTVETKTTNLQYAVEDVVGLTVKEAQGRQLRGNMTVNVKGTQYSTSVPEGVIIAQEPMPETNADVNSVIDVYISAGPREKELRNVCGWERDAAKIYLESLGYRVSEIEVTVSSYERGRVDGMSPAPGTAMVEGDEVVLQISMVEPTTAPTTVPTTAATTV